MRNVYFSFHYADVWKVNIIRNSGIVFGAQSAGFADRSLWERAKSQEAKKLKKLIENGLNGTSVTVALIGRETASRKWVKYELEQSHERGSALIGVHINHVGETTRRGAVPRLLKILRAPIYEWTNAADLGRWVEEAWQQRNNPSLGTRLWRWLTT